MIPVCFRAPCAWSWASNTSFSQDASIPVNPFHIMNYIRNPLLQTWIHRVRRIPEACKKSFLTILTEGFGHDASAVRGRGAR